VAQGTVLENAHGPLAAAEEGCHLARREVAKEPVDDHVVLVGWELFEGFEQLVALHCRIDDLLRARLGGRDIRNVCQVAMRVRSAPLVDDQVPCHPEDPCTERDPASWLEAGQRLDYLHECPLHQIFRNVSVTNLVGQEPQDARGEILVERSERDRVSTARTIHEPLTSCPGAHVPVPLPRRSGPGWGEAVGTGVALLLPSCTRLPLFLGLLLGLGLGLLLGREACAIPRLLPIANPCSNLVTIPGAWIDSHDFSGGRGQVDLVSILVLLPVLELILVLVTGPVLVSILVRGCAGLDG
jgi:hypothetical protein